MICHFCGHEDGRADQAWVEEAAVEFVGEFVGLLLSAGFDPEWAREQGYYQATLSVPTGEAAPLFAARVMCTVAGHYHLDVGSQRVQAELQEKA